jgi:hypothetical protein
MIKSTLALLSLWSACACAADPDPDNSRLDIKDVISGPNLEAVLTALPELARHNKDYRKYRIFVSTVDGKLCVIFSDLDKALGRPGPGPTLAGFLVNLSADGKTVTGFEWQR